MRWCILLLAVGCGPKTKSPELPVDKALEACEAGDWATCLRVASDALLGGRADEGWALRRWACDAGHRPACEPPPLAELNGACAGGPNDGCLDLVDPDRERERDHGNAWYNDNAVLEGLCAQGQPDACKALQDRGHRSGLVQRVRLAERPEGDDFVIARLQPGPDASSFVAVGDGLQVWDAASGDRIGSSPPLGEGLGALLWEDGALRTVLSLTETDLGLWDGADMFWQPPKEPRCPVLGVVPAGDAIITVERGYHPCSRIQVVEGRSKKERGRPMEMRADLYRIAAAAGGPYAAIALGNVVTVLDVEKTVAPKALEVEGVILDMAVDDHGRFVVIHLHPTRMLVWDTSRKAARSRDGVLGGVSLSADGSKLAWLEGNRVHIADPLTLQPLGPPLQVGGPSRRSKPLTFIGDGQSLAVALDERSVLVATLGETSPAASPAWLDRVAPVGPSILAKVDGDEVRKRMVEGTVADPDGRPAAGVRVQLLEHRGTVRMETHTDAKGGFAFDDPQRTSLWIVALRDDGAQRAQEVERGPDERVAVALRLRPPFDPALTRAVVTDDQGAPLPGAPLPDTAFGAADAAGRWATDLPRGVRPRALRVELEGRSWSTQLLEPEAVAELVVPSGRLTAKGAGVRELGLVQDGIHLDIAPAEPATYTRLAPGAYTVWAHDPASHRWGVADTTLGKGEQAVVPVKMDEAGVPFEGVVLDGRSGRPVALAEVRTACAFVSWTEHGIAMRAPLAWSSATTGPTGRFRLEGLAPGPHEIVVERRRYRPRRVEVEVLPKRNPSLQIPLDPSRTEAR